MTSDVGLLRIGNTGEPGIECHRRRQRVRNLLTSQDSQRFELLCKKPILGFFDGAAENLPSFRLGKLKAEQLFRFR
jgi:hypothetical protein